MSLKYITSASKNILIDSNLKKNIIQFKSAGYFFCYAVV